MLIRVQCCSLVSALERAHRCFKCMLYFRVKSDHSRSGVHCRPSIIAAFCLQYNLLLLYNALFGDEIGRKAKPCCDDTHMVSHPTEFQR